MTVKDKSGQELTLESIYAGQEEYARQLYELMAAFTNHITDRKTTNGRCARTVSIEDAAIYYTIETRCVLSSEHGGKHKAKVLLINSDHVWVQWNG